MCTFCDLGICHDPGHRSQALLREWVRDTCELCTLGICLIHGASGPPVGETIIPLFDVKRSLRSTSTSVSLTEVSSTPRRGILSGMEDRTYWNPSQSDEALIISRLLKSPMGTQHAIPKNIHRFWTGGPMSPAVVDDLVSDGARAKQAGWTCYLWYSAEVERVLDGHLDGEIKKTEGIFIFSKRPPKPVDKRPTRTNQRRRLELAGFRVVPIEKLDDSSNWLSELATLVGGAAVQRNWDEVKYFSDLARLLYLNFVGGIHMDVDISLGDMDLTQTYFHNDPNGEVPLMGSLLRDQSDPMIPKLRFLKKIRRRPLLTKEEYDGYMEALSALVEKGMLAAGMLNALIASRPNTTHLKDTIVEFRKAILKNKGLISGMALSRVMLFGKSRQGDVEQAMKWTVPPYLVRLDPDTDESNL
ncbi:MULTISPECIES: hypothetical protein [Corallococcus]|uniref:hypothetical protein n=1 Tax=Corallococcus TaxID=83461 RepID=UPI0011806905|nr:MULTISPECIES: hypothetical protein [Corallococcus]NBD13082.1 hypothetical protein [Corallococcus silvisoli]TSC24662.1 hypothetical protein FOF48_26800 [Corallococcus sp. Z5C101001]